MTASKPVNPGLRTSTRATIGNPPTPFPTGARANRRCSTSFLAQRAESLTWAPVKAARLAWSRREHPETEAAAIDFSVTMLDAARNRFDGDSHVSVVAHNLDTALPDRGKFDAVISSLAIHHVVHERKRALFAEIYDLLNPGGAFCNLEHVSSPNPRLHKEFLERIGFTVETEDPSNKLLDVETQLRNPPLLPPKE
jgi:SAM-dependent methyltransferase